MENLISWGHQEQLLKGQRLWAPLGEGVPWTGMDQRRDLKKTEAVEWHVNKRVPPYALMEKFSLNSSVRPMRRDVMLALEWHANISAGVRYNHKSVWAERTREKYLRVQPCFCVAHWRSMATERRIELCQTENCVIKREVVPEGLKLATYGKNCKGNRTPVTQYGQVHSTLHTPLLQRDQY